MVSSTTGTISGDHPYGSSFVGTVTVAGDGSKWNNSSSLLVGHYGEGTLNITDGGVVNASEDLHRRGPRAQHAGLVTELGFCWSRPLQTPQALNAVW